MVKTEAPLKNFESPYNAYDIKGSGWKEVLNINVCCEQGYKDMVVLSHIKDV